MGIAGTVDMVAYATVKRTCVSRGQHVMELPIAAFDGQSIKDPIRGLQAECQAFMRQP